MARIAIGGATGLLGSALAASLRSDGHTVQTITRRPSAAEDTDVLWDPQGGAIQSEKLEGVDAVVNLAGEPIGGSRWTAETKRRIHDSRVDGTRLLAKTLAGLSERPGVLVSGSAVGFYGDRGDEALTEESGPGTDFMARMCVAWEHAAAPAAEAGIRVVHPRTGVVIASGGPLIDKVEVPFKLGVGGRVGHGHQYVPWMGLDDHVRAMRLLIDGELAGPVNLVAPEPVTNRELTDALGTVLRRPTIMPVPMLAMRLVYGEMGVALASVSQRVLPTRLQAAGFEHRYDSIEAALRVAFGSPAAA